MEHLGTKNHFSTHHVNIPGGLLHPGAICLVSVQRATIAGFGAALSLGAAPTAVPTVGAGVVLRTSLLDCRALLAWAAGFIFGFHADGHKMPQLWPWDEYNFCD